MKNKMTTIQVVSVVTAMLIACSANASWWNCGSSSDSLSGCEGVTEVGQDGQCYIFTNPRGACQFCIINPCDGCPSAGSTVTLQLDSGYCYFSGGLDAWICEYAGGFNTTFPGTAIC